MLVESAAPSSALPGRADHIAPADVGAVDAEGGAGRRTDEALSGIRPVILCKRTFLMTTRRGGRSKEANSPPSPKKKSRRGRTLSASCSKAMFIPALHSLRAACSGPPISLKMRAGYKGGDLGRHTGCLFVARQLAQNARGHINRLLHH